MKKIFILLLVLSFSKLNAQETKVEIKILNGKKGDYWIQVADRNCGAKSNGINSYGEYYSWSTAKKASDKKVSDEALKACIEFRGDGSYTDWRLPNAKEISAIMNKCKREESYATLKNERGDTTSVILFPYAGIISEEKDSKLSNVGEFGYYWGGNGFSSDLAISIILSKSHYNNPLEVKSNKLSVRCVRTAE